MKREFDEQLFSEILNDRGFSSIDQNLSAAGSPEERKQLFSKFLNSVEVGVVEQLGFPGEHIIEAVTLVGQEHNNSNDLETAIHVAESTSNRDIVLLERDGNIHPGINASYTIKVAAENKNAHIVTENQIVRIQNTDHVQYLYEYERSQLMGLYVAYVLAYNPDHPVTVIFGDNHLDEIKVTIESYLSQFPQLTKSDAYLSVIRTQPQPDSEENLGNKVDPRIQSLIQSAISTMGVQNTIAIAQIVKPGIEQCLLKITQPGLRQWLVQMIGTNLKVRKEWSKESPQALAEIFNAALNGWVEQAASTGKYDDFELIDEICLGGQEQSFYNPDMFGSVSQIIEEDEQEVTGRLSFSK